jgi:hypothetical protein
LDPSCAVLLEPWRAVWIDVAKVASSSLKAGLLGLDLDSYTGQTRDLVASRYARDVELFGYDFG